MPGYLLTVSSSVICTHAGQAQPTVPNLRVSVSGSPSVTMTAPYVVAGCILPPPPAGAGPCVIAQWVIGATRVSSGGQPLLLQDSSAVCTPTGTPLTVLVVQPRVRGS